MRATVRNADTKEVLGEVELELGGAVTRDGTPFTARGMGLKLPKGRLVFDTPLGRFEGFAQTGRIDEFSGLLVPAED